jgi:hypothetical protein
MKLSIFFVGLVVTALFVMSPQSEAETVVIVAAGSPISSITADQAADLFLGRANTFPTGGAATPIDLPDGAPARDEFYSKVANKSSAQVKALWAKLVFTGKAQPPKEVSDGMAAKTAVATSAGTIGYVDKSVVDGTVKIVLDLH